MIQVGSQYEAAAVFVSLVLWRYVGGKKAEQEQMQMSRSQEACSMDCSWTRAPCQLFKLCWRARQWSCSSNLESSVRFGFWQMVLGAFLWLWLAGEVQQARE